MEGTNDYRHESGLERSLRNRHAVKTWMAGTSPAMTVVDFPIQFSNSPAPSLRAKRSNPAFARRRMDCFVAFAPLHKRFAFVAGNDVKTHLRLPAARCVRVVASTSPKKTAVS